MRYEQKFRPRKSVTQRLVAVSSKFNVAFARTFPKNVPFVFLAEYPRSGGNWIRDMISDVTQLPSPRFSCLPIWSPGIVLTHAAKPVSSCKCIYVVRDVRDVFVSHFKKTQASYDESDEVGKRILRCKHPSLVHSSLKGEDVRIDSYYNEWLNSSLGVSVGWGAHVRNWKNAEKGGNIVIARYEDFQRQPVETLKQTVRQTFDSDFKDYVYEFSIKRNSFQEQTGRVPGQSMNESTQRRGIVGSWKDELPEHIVEDLQVRFKEELSLFDYN